VVAALTATACAPQTSDNSGGTDEKSGTLRVWLFQEVGNGPKEKVVEATVAAFEKAHEGTQVEVEYIPVETRAQRIKAAPGSEVREHGRQRHDHGLRLRQGGHGDRR
jgi:N,N'-diacetylchitobiose transport system substrate-binding protein